MEETTRNLRKNIVGAAINFFDIIFYELPESTRGDIIFFIHFYGFAAVIIYTFLFGNRLAFQLFLLVGVLIFVQLIVLRGCILTKVEQHYRKEKGTTVDVFLRLMDAPLTNENRKLITISGYGLIFLGALASYVRETLFQTRMN